jgi:uncharacterized protein YndB with AHSA1/START domain
MLRDKIHLTVDHEFPFPPEILYDAWISPEAIGIWRSESLRIAGSHSRFVSFTNEPVVGGGFVSTYFRDGREIRHWGQYIELIRPTRIVTTWLNEEVDIIDPSIIILDISPTATGCHLRISHELDHRWLDFLERVRLSWLHVIQAIESYAFVQITSH